MSARHEVTVDISNQIAEFYSSLACPCAFPRFIYLAGFKHQNFNAGPVMCIDSGALINRLCFHSRSYFMSIIEWTKTQRVNSERHVQCPRCLSEYKATLSEYNPHFQTLSLELIELRAKSIGAIVTTPFSIHAGFSGFQRKDILHCQESFRSVSENDYIRYMTETSPLL